MQFSVVAVGCKADLALMMSGEDMSIVDSTMSREAISQILLVQQFRRLRLSLNGRH